MCEASSSIREWMEQPIVLSDEAWKFAIVSAVAFAVLALGTVSYYYGTASTLYNHTFGYVMWGITAAGVTTFLALYVARAIISQSTIRSNERREANQIREFSGRWLAIFREFFPRIGELDQLPPYENLIGATGYFDQHGNLDFTNGPILRGREGAQPFLAVRLRISNRDVPETLIIGPNHANIWFVSCSNHQLISFHNNLMEDQPETAVFKNWLSRILNGEECHLLRFYFRVPQDQSRLVEESVGPTISLWPNN